MANHGDRTGPHAPVIFVAVGTPPRSNGEADLSAVEETARAIGAHLDGPAVIVTKSTVPVGTAGRVKTLISDENAYRRRVGAFSERHAHDDITSLGKRARTTVPRPASRLGSAQDNNHRQPSARRRFGLK